MGSIDRAEIGGTGVSGPVPSSVLILLRRLRLSSEKNITVAACLPASCVLFFLWYCESDQFLPLMYHIGISAMLSVLETRRGSALAFCICQRVHCVVRQVQDSLDGVEHRFRETAHKAVRIGDRLSKMEGQRARAAEAMELLEFFKVFHPWNTAAVGATAFFKGFI